MKPIKEIKNDEIMDLRGITSSDKISSEVEEKLLMEILSADADR